MTIVSNAERDGEADKWLPAAAYHGQHQDKPPMTTRIDTR